MPMSPHQLLRVGSDAPQGEFVLAARVCLSQLDAIADELFVQPDLALSFGEPDQYRSRCCSATSSGS